MKNLKTRGFTLIEMMVVVLIIGVIAAVVTVSIGEQPGKAKARLTKVALAKLKAEIQLFKGEQNRYPESLEDLVRRPAYIDVRNWPERGYLEELPLDGWDRPFHYAVPGVRGPFDLVSWGEDGKEGGEGVNADLWSHPPR
ncbi:MAG TPA: type II secretion system major pseudopilin GspG [Planctomycetota bacterium]|nr:type II secretion system major pseudopilin GspG [Planctomycetota bacterium]